MTRRPGHLTPPIRRRAAGIAVTLLLGGLVVASSLGDGGRATASAAAPAPATGTATDASPPGTAVDLLAGPGRDWTHLAGATVQDGRVRITGLGRMIVNQDGSGGRPNAPVNLRGPRLAASGDTRITAVLDRPAGVTAELSLYGKVPLVYDEWRRHGTGLTVSVSDTRLHVTVWDDGVSAPVADRTVPAAPGRSPALTVLRRGRTLTVTTGTAQVSVPDPGIFPGPVVVGADAAPARAAWTLSSLTAAPVGAGTVTATATPPLAQPAPAASALRSVAAAARRRLPVGAAVSPGALMTDAGYRALAAGQFSLLTTENDLKPQFVHPQPDVYDFSEGDLLVDFARANGMAVHAHTLVFGEANPRWIQDTPPAGLRQVMFDHIAAVAGHFRGRVAEWDVVNEPLSDDDADYTGGRAGLRRHLWHRAMGESYIADAFRAAHAADPAARLYLNDYGLEADGERWDALLALVTRLTRAGVPIHGVGFEAHVHETGDHISTATLRRHIRELAALGVSARVSEIDVHGERSRSQAAQYGAAMTACVQEPTCTSYTTWGITDRYGSTTEADTYPAEPGDDLLWDVALRPKPAVTTLRRILAAH